MSLQEKYQTLLELAKQNGTSYELSEADGVLHITGNAPSEEAKQQLWDEYNRIDPDYRAGDLMLNVSVGGAAAGGAVRATGAADWGAGAVVAAPTRAGATGSTASIVLPAPGGSRRNVYSRTTRPDAQLTSTIRSR